MLHTIQSNVIDQYRIGDNHLTTLTDRSITVFAVGTPAEIARSGTLDRLRERANELLPGDKPAVVAHSILDAGSLSAGEPFGVEVDGRDGHLVRIIDGPLPEEAIVAIRVIGTHRWVPPES